MTDLLNICSFQIHHSTRRKNYKQLRKINRNLDWLNNRLESMDRIVGAGRMLNSIDLISRKYHEFNTRKKELQRQKDFIIDGLTRLLLLSVAREKMQPCENCFVCHIKKRKKHESNRRK